MFMNKLSEKCSLIHTVEYFGFLKATNTHVTCICGTHYIYFGQCHQRQREIFSLRCSHFAYFIHLCLSCHF